MTKVPQVAIDLAKQFEGFHLLPMVHPGRAHAYICPAEFWTIGYGHLCDPTYPPISEAEAEVYLARDVALLSGARWASCSHRGFHVQPWRRPTPDINAATADQSAGLGPCRYRAKALGLWRRKSAAGACHTAGG